jgi:hypothetical protein
MSARVVPSACHTMGRFLSAGLAQTTKAGGHCCLQWPPALSLTGYCCGECLDRFTGGRTTKSFPCDRRSSSTPSC